MKSVIGIDIGSLSIGAARVGADGAVLETGYRFHNGQIRENLEELLESFDRAGVTAYAVTSSTPDILEGAGVCDNRLAAIAAVRRYHDRVGSVLIVGGEKFGMVLFDEKGEYRKYVTNSSCAAGTGSFLDQQARRLNLSGISEFSDIAYNNTGEIPKIASRCAVFAKTDLIHAQQEGYSLAEICDGLSYGLAKNIADTLLHNRKPLGPVVFIGGVSKNRAVVKHLSRIIDTGILVDENSQVYGAIGAALIHMENHDINEMDPLPNFRKLLKSGTAARSYYYAPLELGLTSYPSFESETRYEFMPKNGEYPRPVEVDLYATPEPGDTETYIGVDIGSTSTKAVIMDTDGRVIAGLYTRTSGRPVEAVQFLFEAIEDISASHNVNFTFLGAGTTGSGRKFIREIISADIALDEITAHARAAVELDPKVDTIIEIGGQDSKFTTLSGGRVTFSIMNNVCAAGTGSFIEEQAEKLNVSLDEFSGRTRGKEAPLASDRCTVFMERDINNYLNRGYSVDEILASVLHSVRENYLTKVAVEKNIGKRVFFQGATAKNRALVAAFEQRLGRPVMVSKYCHLTGAYGVALHLRDERYAASKFRGIGIYKKNIPVHSEVCDLCANHCKLTLAEINGEVTAYGFLCGRDYETKKFVKNEKSHNLLKERSRVLQFKPETGPEAGVTVGIPASLHLVDEIHLWKKFFDILSINVVTSENYRTGPSDGKKLAGAEFCAPLTALHGHVRHLLDRADYVFLPFFLERKSTPKWGRRQYCYYTQFAPSVVATAMDESGRLLMPLLRSVIGSFYTRTQLYKMVKRIAGKRINFLQVSQAYDSAMEFYEERQSKLVALYEENSRDDNDIQVVFLGRPYTVLNPAMNNGIPEIFSRLGIKTWFQDMIPIDQNRTSPMQWLLRAFHWVYASRILETARHITEEDGLYPVLITSFKCGPDSFVIDYFKSIMDGAKKPYLILQLDEHDSSVGYETRIEAAIRAFRNHNSHGTAVRASAIMREPDVITEDSSLLGKKTVLFPVWDPIICRIHEANMRAEGYEVRLLEESDDSIRRSMRHNTGQCIPLNAVVQNAMEHIERHDLRPEETMLWIIKGAVACNIKMFPYYMQKILEDHGNGMEKVTVYLGDSSFFDLSLNMMISTYFANMFGGYIRKMGCRIRPYEKVPGTTDRAVEKSVETAYEAFLNKTSREEALEKIIPLFEAIETEKVWKPKAAIFGDIYARDNDTFNQGLIKTIEEHGGEALTTPYNELLKIIVDPYILRWFREGKYSEAAVAKLLQKTIPMMEKKYYRYFNRILKEGVSEQVPNHRELLGKLNVRYENTGESMENILKIFHVIEQHPDVALFIQTNPAYCCPSLVTESMAARIEEVTGVPIVTIEYDGTGGFKNDDIIPYLKYPRKGIEKRTGKKESRAL